MQSKSSTSLAITSILAILIVFFIGVSNVENAPQRKPFPTRGATADSKTMTEPQTNMDEAKQNGETSDSPQTSIEISNSNAISFTPPAVPKAADPKEISPSTPKEKVELLVKNINSEALTNAGFTDFVVKPQPFSGKLFDQFDLSMLSYLNILDKSVTENRDGNETEVLRAYEFELSDKDQNQEVYDFLKAKIKDELGVTINETNQFGLSSFYINFNQAKDYAFLVVKTRTNVYALSYPKLKDGEKSYFNLVSKLFSELI